MIRRLFIFDIPVILVVLDRLTKLHMIERSVDNGPLLFPGILELVHHRNYGIVANVPLPQPLIILITFAVIVMIGIGTYRALRRKELREVTALMLILGGAIGNLWDRIQWGYVFDWILLFGRSAINLADIFIAVGLLWYLAERNIDQRHEGPPAAWAPERENA